MFNTPVTLRLKNHSVITIQPNEKIASIMLDSQAEADTGKYILNLISYVDRMFIFGGTKPAIASEIAELIENRPYLRNKIVLLDNQEASLIAGLMTRSNIIIICSRGLNVMEQMAMNHNLRQIIMLHYADSDFNSMKSGIPWEDCNADELIKKLSADEIQTIKTCPSKSAEQLDELFVYPTNEYVFAC